VFKPQVLVLHEQGLSQQQIANKLGCAKSTVHHHLHPKSRKRALVRQKDLRVGLYKMVKDMKESSPCLDCGEYFPYYVMDYDHVRGEKLTNVARLARGKAGKQKLLDEIGKCELVCSNCHRSRTHNRSALKEVRGS